MKLVDEIRNFKGMDQEFKRAECYVGEDGGGFGASC